MFCVWCLVCNLYAILAMNIETFMTTSIFVTQKVLFALALAIAVFTAKPTCEDVKMGFTVTWIVADTLVVLHQAFSLQELLLYEETRI